MENNNPNIDLELLTRFLAGEVNQEERELIMQWKEASAENQQQFKDLMNVWQAMDKTSPGQNIDIDREWAHLQKTLEYSNLRSSRTIFLSSLMKYAAAILILIALSFMGWVKFSHKSIESSLTESKETRLPDGSEVSLNAGSNLNYKWNYGRKQRIVALQGEAFFKVAKNPELPFIIKINDAEIKVTGTSFNVKAYKEMDKIEVTVSEGTVSLYRKDNELKKILITRGEKAIYDKQSKAILKQENQDRNYISWKTRLIVFENDSLLGIVKTLSNVYHREIIIQTPEINHCTITTSFENKELRMVLDVLKSTLGIAIEEKNGKIYISGKGC